MPFNLTIPISYGEPKTFSLNTGEHLFVLGSNGSGKSSLMAKFAIDHRARAKKISAHRQTWFPSNSLTLSPHQKRQTEQSIQANDMNITSRWRDDHSQHRAGIDIYNLIDAQNIRAREIANAVDGNNMDLATALSQLEAPISTINELLQLSNLPIEISIEDNEQIVASKSNGTPYSIAELSDGERNAILIAANVLTSKADTLFLIDEPERHLHRSIISPLLTLLFSKRPDCAFIVSTHDVMLPVDNPDARTLLVRDCTYQQSNVSGWHVDLIEPDHAIDENLIKEILGSRKNILFVEGTENSLDKPLYNLIFQNVSVIAKSSCKDIITSVTGIRESDNLHWLNVFGLIDHDGRSTADIDSLKERGIHALSVFSVESIYYHPEIQSRMAVRSCELNGGDPAALISNATDKAIKSIREHVPRMCERVIEKSVREEIFQNLPTQNEISSATQINCTIDVASKITAENEKLSTALNQGNIELVMSRYPIRETSALNKIASELGFQNRTQYENAVRNALINDEEMLIFVKSLFGSLVDDITIQ